MSDDHGRPGGLLSWRDQYALGIPAVDFEHRELIKMINETWARGAPDGESPALTEEMLGELLARISAHFALEERIMRDTAYEAYEPHKVDHEVLLDRLRDIMEAVSDEGYAPGELGRELDEWFLGHFRTHDARLHRRLQA